MNSFVRANQTLWDEWAKLHLASGYYAADTLRGGGVTLGALERAEVGEVTGKTLLHLQCHLGLDTLSWARLGATVTGVDISQESIRAAESLRDELGLAAEFICSDVCDLGQHLNKEFNIVFTSCGVLVWLPDLGRWAELIARYLKPGGVFYISEIHPFKRLLTPRTHDDAGNPITIGYFRGAEPVRVEEQGSYAAESSSWHTAYYWSHGLGEIITPLAQAGLIIEFLHEFDSPEHPGLPVAFSIRARNRT